MDAKTQYWVAADGTKHPSTAQQIDHLTSGQPSEAASSSIQPNAADSTTASLAPDYSGLDELDREMLADAERSSDSDEEDDGDSDSDDSSDESDVDDYRGSQEKEGLKQMEHARSNASEASHEDALDEELAWIPRDAPPAYSKGERLPVPVVIPQIHPGIKHPFSRAWGPILESRGVRREEFLQFLDHLNVCKAASPPLQMLQLAGEIIGFTPVPFSFAVAAGTTVISIGAMYAVAKYRIVRYLKRVNREYFFPRGLYATVAKQKTINQYTGQPAEEPILGPVRVSADNTAAPSLRECRLQAMGSYVAPIEYHLAAPSQEKNFLDRWSARRTAKKARKSERKAMKKGRKPIKKQMKLERKIGKSRAEGKEWKIPELEMKMKEKQLDQPGQSKDAVRQKKRARKFLFVVVGHLDDEALQRLKSQA